MFYYVPLQSEEKRKNNNNDNSNSNNRDDNNTGKETEQSSINSKATKWLQTYCMWK